MTNYFVKKCLIKEKDINQGGNLSNHGNTSIITYGKKL